MNKLIRHIITAVCLLIVISVGAVTPQEITEAVNAAKEAPKNRSLNHSAAETLKSARRYKESIPFYLNSGNVGNLGLAEVYFYLYDFDKAEEYLEKYLDKRTKAEAENDTNFTLGDNSEPMDWTDYLRSRIELGKSMLDRVEKIQIIDSINVPAEGFFEFIKLAKSAGSLQDENIIDEIVPQSKLEELGITGVYSPVFVSENGDDMIWYGSTENGDAKMFENTRLADGTWDNPTQLFDYNSIFGNTNGSWVSYPFLMSDGVTLYFAADGDNSLGELDIFISRRDEDGFLQPSNIGMPYNSPHNDYLYAIDEITGTGWWVTDRNHIDDSVTIYTFIPQDLRINYPVDTENLADYAKITSISRTWKEGVDYSDLKNKIHNISNENTTKSGSDFQFALPGSVIYHSLSDFKNPKAKDMMVSYINDLKDRESKLTHLSDLRKSYRDGNRGVANEIKSLEQSLEKGKVDLRRTKNQIIKLESGTMR